MMVVLLATMLTACGDREPKPELPASKLGNNLTLVVKDVQEKDTVYYRDLDDAFYSVAASGPDTKLALVRVQVYNRSARTIKLQVGPDGYLLLDKDSKEFKSLNPFGDTRRLSPTLPSKEVPYQFIWGPFDLAEGYSIEAWAVFDIPKDVTPWQFRWNPVETVFVPFYAPTPRPEADKPDRFPAWAIIAAAVSGGVLIVGAGGFFVWRRRTSAQRIGG